MWLYQKRCFKGVLQLPGLRTAVANGIREHHHHWVSNGSACQSTFVGPRFPECLVLVELADEQSAWRSPDLGNCILA